MTIVVKVSHDTLGKTLKVERVSKMNPDFVEHVTSLSAHESVAVAVWGDTALILTEQDVAK